MKSNAAVPAKLIRVALLGVVLATATTVASQDNMDDLAFVHPTDAPGGRRNDGPVRAELPVVMPKVQLIAPAEWVGLTVKPQPVIYWFLTRDTDKPVVICVSDPREKKPLFKVTLPGPNKAGLRKLDLSQTPAGEKPVTIAPDVPYKVVVTVLFDEGGGGKEFNPFSTAKIQRLDPAPIAIRQARDALALVRAAKSVWFDYVDALETAIANDPKNKKLLRTRESLFNKEKLLAAEPDAAVEQAAARAAGAVDNGG